MKQLCTATDPKALMKTIKRHFYETILMHLLGKSHGAVKNDIQNKINHLLRSDKRDTRDYDNIPPILGEDT